MNLRLDSNPIAQALLLPLLFWFVQTLGGFIRYKLLPTKTQQKSSYLLELGKSIGFNLCCIALAVDLSLLSQYKEEVIKSNPNFVFLLITHIFTFVFSLTDQISYAFFDSKIKDANKLFVKNFWKFIRTFIFIIFFFVGIFSICLIYNNVIICEVKR